MPNLTDKEIDRLSREAAEFYEPDDSALSWSRLEQTLNSRIPDKPPGNGYAGIRPFAWGSVILAITGLTYFLIKSEKYTPSSTQTSLKKSTERSETPASIPVHDEAKRPVLTPGTYSIPYQDSRVNKDAVASKTNGNKSIPGFEPETRQNKSLSGETVMATGRTMASPDPDPATEQGNSGITAKDGFTGVPAAQNNDGASGNISSAEKNLLSATLPGLAESAPSRFRVSANDSLLNRFPLIGNTGGPRPPHQRLDVNRSLTIGIGMGPDYTDGGGITDDLFSNNIGVSLGYYLTGRLSVNTGFYYTKKYYWADGKDFRTPSFWPMAFPVQYVNGTCDMMEIPVTLRYDFPVGIKTNFFVNGGLSSYLLRRESYTFYYHNISALYGKTFENNSHENYLFSVVNLSAGFERQLGSGFSFQVEPFVKLPTQGIGFGNIRMNSYGVLFSLRYAPILKKTRK
jgi:hypothetical protein